MQQECLDDEVRRLISSEVNSIVIYHRLFVSGIKYIFLVGGFAESPMLQQEIRREFGHNLKILIPNDVSLTILKGKQNSIFSLSKFK